MNSGHDAPDLPETHYLDNRIFTDEDIFAGEMRRIFAETWLFVCHGGEIAGRTYGSLLTNIGSHTFIEHFDQGKSDLGPATRIAMSMNVRSAQHRAPDKLQWRRLSDSGGMIVDHIFLEILNLIVTENNF